MSAHVMATAFRIQELEDMMQKAIREKSAAMAQLCGQGLSGSQLMAMTQIFKTNDILQANARVEIRKLRETLCQE